MLVIEGETTAQHTIEELTLLNNWISSSSRSVMDGIGPPVHCICHPGKLTEEECKYKQKTFHHRRRGRH